MTRAGRTSIDDSAPATVGLREPASAARSQTGLLWSAASALLAAVIAWAYWPTFAALVDLWLRQPDYSHGFLVAPISVFFLWSRRDQRPALAPRPSAWGGVVLLAAGIARVAASVFYLTPLDSWTIPVTLAGAVWLLCGWPWLRWMLPSIAFLWFMAPIPYSAERWLSVPLQAVATELSTAALVCLQQPAIAEGNTIILGENTLLVEEACSGLRIFVGIAALACAFAMCSRWAWWKKLLVLAAACPVAILANSIRIVTTGMLYQGVSQEAAIRFSHDISGFAMIPIAAGLFWLLLSYFDRMFIEVEEVPHSHLA
ncbi:MAG: exosortase [Planctomycetaceae bacterium]|nr:exosortase [Planctomycetaceae bacterium]